VRIQPVVLALAALVSCRTASDPVPLVAPDPVTRVAPPAPTPEKVCGAAPYALEVVIDRSGSMTGARMAAAIEGAHAILKSLSDDELIGVISFDSTPQQVTKLRCAKDRTSIDAEIASIVPGGGTQFLPALDLAVQQLQSIKAPRRHIVFVSDGFAPSAGVVELVEAAEQEGITVSTVALGADADRKLLARIAAAGRGRAYDVAAPTDLPAVLAKEAALART
jgi:Ca-activated chloride channel homolog